MKKTINMILLSVFTFTLLMSIFQVDRFSESMTIENYDNEEVESYYMVFDSDSADSNNKNRLLNELDILSSQLEFNIYIIDVSKVREDRLSIIAKTNDRSYINNLPIRNAKLIEIGNFSSINNGFTNLFQVFSKSVLSLDLVDTLPTSLQLENFKINVTIPLNIENKQIVSLFSSIASNYNAQIVKSEVYVQDSFILRIFNMNTFIYFSFLCIQVLVVFNAILSNSKEIIIRKIEGYSSLNIWKSLTINELSLWPFFIIVPIQLGLILYVYPYRSIIKYLIKIELIYLMFSIIVLLIAAWLMIWIICKHKESELIKGRLPLRRIQYLVMILKIATVSMLLTTVSAVVDDVMRYTSMRSNSREYFEKYDGYYAIDGSNNDSRMMTEELSRDLYESIDLEKFVYSAYENDNGQIIVSVNEDYFERAKISVMDYEIYFYAPSDKTFLPSMLADYFPNNFNEFAFNELEKPLGDYALKNRLMIVDGDDRLIIYIPTENTIYHSIIKFDGSESDFQNYINSVTLSKNLGTPLTSISLNEAYVEVQHIFAKTALRAICVLIVTLSVLLLCNFNNVEIFRKNYVSVDRIYISEGYALKKSTRDYLVNNMFMYLLVSILGSVILKISPMNYILPLILILLCDLLAIVGGNK